VATFEVCLTDAEAGLAVVDADATGLVEVTLVFGNTRDTLAVFTAFVFVLELVVVVVVEPSTLSETIRMRGAGAALVTTAEGVVTVVVTGAAAGSVFN